MNGKFTSGLKQRLATSCVALIGLLLALIFASYPLLQPLFVAVVAGIIGIGLQEYYRMADSMELEPVSTAAIFCSTIFVFAVYLSTLEVRWAPLPYVALAFSFIALFVHFFFKGSRPLLNFAVTTFGLVWVTIPLSLLVSITFFFPEGSGGDGRFWIGYLLAVTMAADSGAYFVGKQFGKRKLAPKISPNKTIEGAVGGLLCGLGISLAAWALVGTLFPSAFSLTLGEAIVLGLILALMAELGDLAESLLKRDAGIKDSNMLPGLGGVLDMVDSLIFTTPVLFLFLTIR